MIESVYTVPVRPGWLNAVVSASVDINLNERILRTDRLAVFESLKGVVPALSSVKLDGLAEVVTALEFRLFLFVPVGIEDLVNLQWFQAALDTH